MLSIRMLKVAKEVALAGCTCKKALAESRSSEDLLMLKSCAKQQKEGEQSDVM